MDKDRRSAARVPCEVWVEEQHEKETYYQRAVNLSVGGLFLDKTVPHPVGTVVHLKIELPGDTAVEVKGQIVATPEASGLGMCVQFVDLPEDARARIEKFVGATGA